MVPRNSVNTIFRTRVVRARLAPVNRTAPQTADELQQSLQAIFLFSAFRSTVPGIHYTRTWLLLSRQTPLSGGDATSHLATERT